MADKNVITYLLELEDKVSQELKKTSKQADRLETELEQLRKEQKRGIKVDKARARALSGMKNGLLAAAAAAAATGAGLIAMGTHSVATASNLEKFETRLGQLLGGLDKGKARVQELFEISASTPFQIQGLVEAEATLEAFGVNATRVRQGVMDLAGATGMDLKDAANAVGKALSAGAGAADQLREKGVLAMVEVQAGMSITKMSTDQFREALVNTLETNERLAGGTQKLATTFSGLISTLRDQFTVFSKQVADAKLFATAKAMLVTILGILDDNKEGTADWAEIVGVYLANGLVSVFDLSFKIAAIVMRVREGWLTVKQVVLDVAAAYFSFQAQIFKTMSLIPVIGEAYKVLASAMESAAGNTNRALAATADQVDHARKSQQWLLETGDKAVRKIGMLTKEYQNAADAAKGIKVPKDDKTIMKIAGIDSKALDKAASQAKKAKQELDKFANQLQRLGKEFDSQAAKTRKPLKESERLKNALSDMGDKLQQAALRSIELGDAGMAAFIKIKDSMKASMSEIEAAIPKAQRAETMATVGAGMDTATDIMSTGGMGVLGGMGPVGAGAAGLIGIGQQGQQAYEQEVDTKAQERADARAAEMQKEADKLRASGASEAALAARGLSSEDIAKAGEVTAKDVEKAEAETDRGEIMAQQVEAVVKGVIDGIAALLEGLPDILSTLIPLLLVDLPLALIEAIPTLIEELIPVLLWELPKGIVMMFMKVVPKILRMVFIELPVSLARGIERWWKTVKKWLADLFSFGSKQVGGYVPKTSTYLLHQGERVVPSSGAGSGTASKGLGAFGMGGSKSLTVNTQVVHPDSIHQLGKMIDDELGAHGRATVPLWGSSSIPRSI